MLAFCDFYKINRNAPYNWTLHNKINDNHFTQIQFCFCFSPTLFSTIDHGIYNRINYTISLTINCTFKRYRYFILWKNTQNWWKSPYYRLGVSSKFCHLCNIHKPLNRTVQTILSWHVRFLRCYCVANGRLKAYFYTSIMKTAQVVQLVKCLGEVSNTSEKVLGVLLRTNTKMLQLTYSSWHNTGKT